MTEHYELLYIIPAKYTAEEILPIIDRITAAIKDNGGEITRDDNLGKLKLAYPIKQTYQGYYILNEFDLKPLNLKKLDDTVKLDTDVLRHMIVKKKIKTTKEIEEERSAQERLLKEKEQEIKKDEEESKKEAPVKEKEKKVSLEELDKKLDEILKDDII
jgi:small subunit ribosomal protein S6